MRFVVLSLRLFVSIENPLCIFLSNILIVLQATSQDETNRLISFSDARFSLKQEKQLRNYFQFRLGTHLKIWS